MKIALNTAKILRNVPLPDEVGVTHTEAVVVDVGSLTTRVGFAGDNAPRLNERSVVLREVGAESMSSSTAAASGSKPLPAARVVQSRAATSATTPACFNAAYAMAETDADVVPVIRSGNVADWAAWEAVMNTIDDMLLLRDAEQSVPVLLTEKALVPHAQRRRMAEILFESHQVPSMYVALSPVLALYASGLCTGLSVELGNDESHIVPVFQGFGLFHATHGLPLGGDALTDLFAQRSSSHVKLPENTLAHRRQDLWRYVKEKCGAVLPDRESYDSVGRPTTTSSSSGGSGKHSASCRLPDGTVLRLGAERYAPAEALFRPKEFPTALSPRDPATVVDEVQLRTTHEPLGIHELLVDAARRCDADLLPYFMDNIVLSGGNSLWAGLPTRLEKEVQALLPPTSERVRVVADVERREAAFVGGSILASLPTFQEMWVTRAVYDEEGSMAVVRGCL